MNTLTVWIYNTHVSKAVTGMMVCRRAIDNATIHLLGATESLADAIELRLISQRNVRRLTTIHSLPWRTTMITQRSKAAAP